MKRKRISGCAAIVVFPEHVGLPETQIVDYGCEESTNIRMELMACAKGLEWALQNSPWPDVTRIFIVTDLEFIIRCHYSAQHWKKNGWRMSSGEPVANEDLWDAILKSVRKLARIGLRVDFHWKKGKKDDLGKLVDDAAKAAAQRAGYDSDFGYRPGSYSRSLVPGGAAATRLEAIGQILVIRPYMKKVRSGREEKISFNIFDESTQTYSGKFFAYAEQFLSADLHRGNGYRVRFNFDRNFPQIVERIEPVHLPRPRRTKGKTAP